MTLPKCRTERGYDTHVKIDPPQAGYDDKIHERSRMVIVRCTRHHNECVKNFPTSGLSSQEIAIAQNEAFDDCFDVVHDCCLVEERSL